MANNQLNYIIKIQDLASKVLNNASMSANKFSQKISETQKYINKLPKSITNLNIKLEQLKTYRDASFSVNRIRFFNTHIQKTQRELRRLENLPPVGFIGRIRKIGSSLRGLVGFTGGIFAIGAAFNGIKSAIGLGAEMEQNRIRFQTYLGSVEKGNNMIKNLAKFSNATPFTNDEIQKGASTLLNFGVSGAKVIPILKTIGDVSGGNKERFSSLSLAFGQMKSTGKLMGQDLLQMINAGFNPLQEISRTTGESVSKLKEQMSKGAISAQMVEKAFQTASSKGGAFNNMLEKQSKTLSGRWSTLVGKIQDKIALFMEKLNPLLGKIVDFAIKVIDAFSKIPVFIKENITWFGILGVALGSLATSFLVLKIPMMAMWVAMKMQAMWTGIVTAAQWAWNIAMNANPIGLIIGGIIFLGAIITWIISKTDGWGKQWDSIVKFMKLSFMTYVEAVKLYFSTLVNGIMIGIDKIKLGWYNFKEAVGMGNSTENQSAIAKINADVVSRQKAITDGAKKVVELGKKAKNSLKWELNWSSNKSLSDIAKKTKDNLGMNVESNATNTLSKENNTSTIEQTTENIVTGGKKQTVLTINIEKVIENIDQKISDGVGVADNIVDEVLDGLTRRIHGTARGLIN